MEVSEKILSKNILRRRLIVWRITAMFAIAVLFILSFIRSDHFKGRSYIAHVSISGEILEDRNIERKLSVVSLSQLTFKIRNR